MTRIVRLVTVLGAMVALVGGGAPARATGSLNAVGSSISFSGSFDDRVVPSDSGCTDLTCDTVTVDVTLPSGTWSTPGGMLVGVTWGENVDGFQDLDLTVYGPDGSLAAKADTLIYSQSEAAWVQNPVNGTYTVRIVPKTALLGAVAYTGSAVLERGVAFSRDGTNNEVPFTQTMLAPGTPPSGDLIPDLVPTTPRNFHIETGEAAGFYLAMDRGIRHQPSCYPQETTGVTGVHPEDPAPPSTTLPVRCLRWDQGEYNYGAGPFELRNYTDVGADMWQAVWRTDGTYSLHNVGKGFFEAAHGHFHYEGFTTDGLYSSDGQTLVAEAQQKGICTVDIVNGRQGQEGDALNTYSFPGTCDTDSHKDPSDPSFPDEQYFRMGISVGWADIYPWFIPDQFVDISDVPDGVYMLKTHINAEHRLIESNYDNDQSSACVAISGETATPVPCPGN